MKKIKKITSSICNKLNLKKDEDAHINNSEYRDLNPIDNLPYDNEYIKALHYGICNKKIKNIAITGPYGSGKSSIINSYIKNYPEEKCINISLANFNSLDIKKTDSNDKKINQNSYLEAAILKQLFYKVKSKDIPQSRFKKIEKISLWKIYASCILLSIILFLVIFFFFPQGLLYLVTKLKISANYYHISINLIYILAMILVLLVLLFISWIIKIFITRYRVKEININKISISSNGMENVFDKTIDEILYFFQETEYEIVFFEDLDRFDELSIFIKLRELNTLINNYELINNKVIFVYAIKDELFSREERTKFFDFVIPVIPYINSTNSFEKLKELFANEKNNDGSIKNLKYNLSIQYINLISPFIDNMRTLTNIYNEFITYKNLLEMVHLDNKNLFSIILFKNLYPNDFSDLENEKGIVKEAFNDKKAFINALNLKLNEDITKLKEILENIDKDILRDVKEAKSAMLAYLSNYKSGHSFYLYDIGSYSYETIMQDDFDLSIFNRKCRYRVDCYRGNAVYGDNLKEKISQTPRNYLERIDYLKNASDEKKRKIIEKINIYKKQINEINEYSLKYILDCYNINKVLSEKVRCNDLLVFLLRNGFINENYSDYINYFHANSITVNEMNFIQNIRTRKFNNDFSFTIKNVARVCERMEEYEFKQKEALNFNLAEYLITDPNSNKCKNFFLGFMSEDEEHMRFIELFIKKNKNNNIHGFIKQLCKYYKKFWYTISNKNYLSKERKEEYLLLIFVHADIEDIVTMNIDNCLNNYIVGNVDILQKIDILYSDRLIDILKNLNITFENVDLKGVSMEVVDYIFEYRKYILNKKMIQEYFIAKYPDQIEELNVKNCTTILKTNDQILISCIKDNLEKYVRDVVLKLKENVKESKEAIRLIIDSLMDQDIKLCIQLLIKEEIKWDQFSECFTKEIISQNDFLILCNNLLDYDKIIETWQNLVFYYNHFSITDSFLRWLDRSIDLLINSETPDDFTNSDMFKNLIMNDNLNEETFRRLIMNYKPSKFNFNLKELSEQKINEMINVNYIPFSREYFIQIEKINFDSSIKYLINYKADFLNSIKLKEFDLDFRIIDSLLKSNRLNEFEMNEVLEVFDEHDMSEDIACIIKNMKVNISKRYVNAAWDKLKKEDKYELLLNQIDIFTNQEISEKLKELDDIYKDLSKREAHLVKLTDDNLGYNQRLVNKLKEKGYLSSGEKKNNLIFARVRKG